jgi:predicted dehydrogenase
MRHGTSRRDFLKQTAVAGVGFWVAGGVTLADDKKSPNQSLNIACIGVGGKGNSDADQAANHGNIVAICDIDDRPLDEIAKNPKFAQAKKYHDFRKMLEEMDKNIDAVTVSTPDHTHAPASIMAMKMGKHVYCQKPLTHDVYEARMMRETAAKYKVATQMGNQGTAENGLRRAVEIIQAGAIGPVHEAHVWTNRPIWPQAPGVVSRPTDMPPVPKYVHWDLFLGPAPYRPYHPAYHPFAWRGWWDFGTGALGDMACHTANMAFMALKLGYPTSVSAESGPLNPETYPGWARITYEFPARGDMPPVKLIWYEGKKDGQRVLPPQELTKGESISDSGSLLVGDKGILFSPNDYGASYKLLPEKDFEGYHGPAETLPRNGHGDDGMKAEWVAAIKGGPAPMSNFGYAGMLTETVLLGNVAMRVGKRMEWDGESMKSPNCPEAAQFVRREYRKGWTL